MVPTCRWCITGTPISRGLVDLYGLMFFLHAAPCHERFWWNRVCQWPTEAGSPAGVQAARPAAPLHGQQLKGPAGSCLPGTEAGACSIWTNCDRVSKTDACIQWRWYHTR